LHLVGYLWTLNLNPALLVQTQETYTHKKHTDARSIQCCYNSTISTVTCLTFILPHLNTNT